ncbi:interferon lambda receptor 1 isoform X1 [Bufo gargarizans]|uniref:interferon lambda receptor 1 isoform X1 n=1 Tax=Bufo gargarizans TaxID=30331 RepID=UPI001CF39962|nr:interferon lambda receptor 1 isoform X1 [Bufo gargarizans]
MSACLKWTLLIVSSMAGHLAGQLHEPTNVKIESRNYSLFLTWLPAPENPSSVTYEVQYTNFTYDSDTNDTYRWTPVPTCENISATECNFSCILMKFWDWNHTVQVRTVSPARSPWVQIQNIEYMFTVDPDPPNLTVNQGDDYITVKALAQMPACVRPYIFYRTLKYFVMIQNKYNTNEVIEQELDGPPITIKTLGYNGEYCVTAKTILTTGNVKRSNFSCPICLNFTPKDGRDHTVLLAVPALFLIFSGIAIITCLVWYKIRVTFKMPQALDFSNNKYCQKNPCLAELDPNIYHSVTICNMAEEDFSTKLQIPDIYDDGDNIYPTKGRGYMVRPSMQTLDPHRQLYFSSKGLEFSSSSDHSSSGCTCPNTSGSVTNMFFEAKNDQTSDCSNEINIDVSRDVQMFPSTSISESNRFDSLPTSVSNSLGNVLFDTLCIGGNNDPMDISDGESDNQYCTDSGDDLDSLHTDYKKSDSKFISEDQNAHKDCSSGYTLRTCMSRKY